MLLGSEAFAASMYNTLAISTTSSKGESGAGIVCYHMQYGIVSTISVGTEVSNSDLKEIMGSTILLKIRELRGLRAFDP